MSFWRNNIEANDKVQIGKAPALQIYSHPQFGGIGFRDSETSFLSIGASSSVLFGGLRQGDLSLSSNKRSFIGIETKHHTNVTVTTELIQVRNARLK